MQQIPNRTLQNLFRLVADWEALGAPDSFLHLLGVLDRAPIDALLTKYLDFSKIKGTLALTATNLTQGTSDAFYLIEGDERVEQAFINVREPDPSYTLTRENYKLAVEASASIPMAWEPVVMNLGGATPNKYVDGGVANNAPVRIAAQLGATDITVILLDPAQTKPRDQALNGPSDILSASLDVMFQKILEDDMQLARQIPGVTINTVRPAAPLGIGVLEFSNAAAIEAAFQTGVAAGQHPVKLLL